MSDAIITVIVSSVVGPALLLVLTRLIDRRNAARSAVLAEAVASAVSTNSAEHGNNAALLIEVRDGLAAHREEFAQYREEHSHEHALINRIITTH